MAADVETGWLAAAPAVLEGAAAAALAAVADPAMPLAELLTAALPYGMNEETKM